MNIVTRLLFVLILLLPNVVIARQIEIMSYNVENLFDTLKDKGKNDWTYLPNGTRGKKDKCERIRYWRYREDCLTTDWNKKNLDLKLNQIVKVIKSRGRVPDILALIEIENENVVRQLAKKLGYSHQVVTNSPDRRGVDVALVYNESKVLKKIDSREHEVKGENFVKYPTRNVLEVEFKIKDKYVFTIYVNHWPSLRGPSSSRVAAAEVLKKAIEANRKRHPDGYVMAVGDFNTIPEDNPHPFNSVLLKNGFMFDVHELFMKDKTIDRSAKSAQPPGTYFFPPKMAWNVLDHIFIDPKLKNTQGLHVDHRSYQIYAPKFITHTYVYMEGESYFFGSKVNRTPRRYEFAETTVDKVGFSDHFPILVKLKF